MSIRTFWRVFWWGRIHI